MFGEPIRNDKGWEIKKLGEVTNKISSGATPTGGKENYKISGISLIRSMNVHNGYFEYKDLAYISNEQARQLKNVEVELEDILLNITGASIARSCLVPSHIIPARVNQHVMIIRIKNKILNSIFLNNLFLNNVDANAIAIGGTIPPAITAAIGRLPPEVIVAASVPEPNTYAALFTGPPISIAIIPPRTAPNKTALEPDIPFNQLFKALLIIAANGFINNTIPNPVINTDNTGYNKIIFKPLKVLGIPANAFIKPCTTYPAKNPPSNAPINPEPPAEAIAPATNPAASAALSLIL